MSSSEAITVRLRADACRQQAWMALNGSSADALRFGSASTYAFAGDPEARSARLAFSRRLIGEMTDARLRELGR